MACSVDQITCLPCASISCCLEGQTGNHSTWTHVRCAGCAAPEYARQGTGWLWLLPYTVAPHVLTASCACTGLGVGRQGPIRHHFQVVSADQIWAYLAHRPCV